MLKKHLTNYILIFVLILFANSLYSQQKWPNTLLWRISGNGLTKPSYLFGTMHVQDKRIFNLSDSLYHYLEQAEGFALEIDFREFMDSIFKREIDRKENEILKDNEDVVVDTKKYGKSADSLLKQFGIKKNKLTRKQLKEIRDYRMNKILEKGEMPTILDAYLYGMASRHGKWLGAVEDVKDQLDLSDELGAELTPDEVFQPESSLRLSLEQMIKIYTAQDLNLIESYSLNRMRPDLEAKMLSNRNYKMAMRMDSLGHIRSMFFAVGAAHLPGDSGVIKLLRKKGFSVEPVLSLVKRPAEEYANKLAAKAWTKVDDEDKFYSVEMPGVPSPHNAFGEIMKMKILLDVTTMTFYMTGHTISGTKSDADMEKVIDEMMENMEGMKGKSSKKKIVSKKGLAGAEAIIQSLDGYYKVQIFQKNKVIYLLIAGSNKKTNLSTGDVDKFFNSLIVHDRIIEKKDWVKFELPQKAASVMLPGQPKQNKKFEEGADGTEWKFTVYDYVDMANGIYYIFQVRDLRDGYYLESDSVYFKGFKQNMLDKADKIEKDTLMPYNGFSSLRFDGSATTEALWFKTFNVIRGNRIYTLMAMGATEADFSSAESFFSSLTLQPYQPAEWKTHSDAGFQTWAPSPFTNREKDNDDGEKNFFGTYNVNDVVSYEVFKEPLSKYYWVESDSAYFALQGDNYESESDSLVYKKNISNGKLKGVEQMFVLANNNNRKKVRLFVNGDTLYTLLTFIPSQYVNDINHQRFFDDFRVLNQVEPTIYKNKAGELLNALNTKDSAEFEELVGVINKITFTAKDLPHLHQAITKKYKDYAPDKYIVNDKLINIIQEIADPSTVTFIQENYAGLKSDEELQYDLLNLLAKIKTKDSYQLLKKLLVEQLPSKENAEMLIYPLSDSLELTKNLYPEILKLSSDTLFVETIISVTNRLLDSNILTLDEVQPYKVDFIKGAKRMINRVKAEEEEYWWQYTDWTAFLGKFNDKETNELLQQFLKLNALDFKEAALMALVKNNQPVAPAEVEKLAADKGFRLSLYEYLKKIGKEKLFPPKYYNQKSFAESEIYEIATEDEQEVAITFVGERVADFLGKKKKFYLFKLTYDYEDGKESYLGIAGPYELNSKTLVTYSDASGIYYDELFDKNKTDKQFKAYLADMEEYFKKYRTEELKK